MARRRHPGDPCRQRCPAWRVPDVNISAPRARDIEIPAEGALGRALHAGPDLGCFERLEGCCAGRGRPVGGHRRPSEPNPGNVPAPPARLQILCTGNYSRDRGLHPPAGALGTRYSFLLLHAAAGEAGGELAAPLGGPRAAGARHPGRDRSRVGGAGLASRTCCCSRRALLHRVTTAEGDTAAGRWRLPAGRPAAHRLLELAAARGPGGRRPRRALRLVRGPPRGGNPGGHPVSVDPSVSAAPRAFRAHGHVGSAAAGPQLTGPAIPADNVREDRQDAIQVVNLAGEAAVRALTHCPSWDRWPVYGIFIEDMFKEPGKPWHQDATCLPMEPAEITACPALPIAHNGRLGPWRPAPARSRRRGHPERPTPSSVP